MPFNSVQRGLQSQIRFDTILEFFWILAESCMAFKGLSCVISTCFSPDETMEVNAMDCIGAIIFCKSTLLKKPICLKITDLEEAIRVEIVDLFSFAVSEMSSMPKLVIVNVALTKTFPKATLESTTYDSGSPHFSPRSSKF